MWKKINKFYKKDLLLLEEDYTLLRKWEATIMFLMAYNIYNISVEKRGNGRTPEVSFFFFFAVYSFADCGKFYPTFYVLPNSRILHLVNISSELRTKYILYLNRTQAKTCLTLQLKHWKT